MFQQDFPSLQKVKYIYKALFTI